MKRTRRQPATSAADRPSNSVARSFAAPADTRGIARTPEFRHLTRLSAIDVIINGKSFSPPRSCARATGESNGPQYRANRVRAPDARRTARRAGRDVCPGSPRPGAVPVDKGGRHGRIHRTVAPRQPLSPGSRCHRQGAWSPLLHPVRGRTGRGSRRRAAATRFGPHSSTTSSIRRADRPAWALIPPDANRRIGLRRDFAFKTTLRSLCYDLSIVSDTRPPLDPPFRFSDAPARPAHSRKFWPKKRVSESARKVAVPHQHY